MKNIKTYNRTVAEKVIKNMEKRGMEGHFFQSKEELTSWLSSKLEKDKSVSWGGSQTLGKLEVIPLLKMKCTKIYNRAEAKTPQEVERIYHDALSCDYYFMSTNAITHEGELLNIDGIGNRLAALIYGPRNVFIIAGLNKLVRDQEAALERIKSYAAPINAVRLSKNTPCTKTGLCSDCLSKDCICSHTVITRRSFVKNRIKVLLVDGNYGY